MTRDDTTTATLAALLEVLLPGDELFPSASTLGLESLVAERLGDWAGPAALDALAAALAASGAPFAALAPAARVPMVARLEREHRLLFDQLARAAYFSYYQAPAVQDAVRALGFAYNAVPLPKGYPVGSFDLERDRPRHGRGRYVATHEVRRVDLSGLDFLAPPR